MRLIINADDFGLTNGVTEGIVESMLRGVVSSTTAMMCVAESAENLRRWSPEVEGRVGLHLQLTDGVPCAEASAVPTLLDAAGRFPRSWRSLGRLNPEEVKREWRAQFEKIVGLGVRPTHFDTHHNVQRLPGVLDAYAEFAAECGVPARSLSKGMSAMLRARGVLCAEFCETNWPEGDPGVEGFCALVRGAFERTGGAGTIELMCHPGYADAELERKSSYVAVRERELRALCDPRLAGALREMGVEIVGPSALGGARELAAAEAH